MIVESIDCKDCGRKFLNKKHNVQGRPKEFCPNCVKNRLAQRNHALCLARKKQEVR